MPNRTRRLLPSLAGAVVAAATLLLPGMLTRAAPAAPGGGVPKVAHLSEVSDEGRLLTPHQRASLDRLLHALASQSGSPLSVRLVPHLARHEAIEELARRTFADDGMDAPGPPRVLLVVAAREHRSAIETGQGPAGIVPEVDGRRIVARLDADLAHHRLSGALDEAVAEIAASARATAERRKPLPPDPLEARPPAPQVAPVDVIEPAAGAVGAGTKPEVAPAPVPPPGDASGRSLVPTAALVSAAVVIGLALRRRRRLVEERAAQPPPRTPDPKGPRSGKSVGDRPMS